jgi:hypothetical protein
MEEKTSKGFDAFATAIHELEQMITANCTECNLIRNEIARLGGVITPTLKERFYVAKAKAVYDYIRQVSQ